MTESYGVRTWNAYKTQGQKPSNEAEEVWKVTGWLLWRNLFQPVLLGTIITGGPAGCVHCLVLSDSGSSIAFCDEEYMREIGLQASGTWQGVLETLQTSSEITTPFYELTLKLEHGSYTFFALSTTGLGNRPEIPKGVMGDIARMFRIEPESICRVGGRVRLLIGQDTASLLLKPLTHVNDRAIADYLPAIARDLTIQRSPISPMLAVTGSIGVGNSMGDKTNVYSNIIVKEHYKFLVAERLYIWSCLFVCLFVCLSVCLSQILSQIFNINI